MKQFKTYINETLRFSQSEYVNEWKLGDKSASSVNKVSASKSFIYEIHETKYIKIFDNDWPNYDEYKYKVFVDGNSVNLNSGYTKEKFPAGIREIEIEDIDNVTDCHYMFYNCYELVSVPLFNTSKVKNMQAMFWKCESLKNVPNFNTKNVTNMIRMFYGCKNIEHVPLFDTYNVKDMENMFVGCDSLSDPTINQWKKIYDFGTGYKR